MPCADKGWRCRAWEPGPILVKEARQAVRSQALPGVLCLLLLVLAAASLLHLAALLTATREQMTAGFGFFLTSLIILLFAQGAAALVLFHRTVAERAPDRRDLLYITTLRPPQIVRGKFTAAMTFALVLLSAGLPFVVLSYFLRGVGLPLIGGSLLGLVLLTALWNLWAIAMGVYPAPVIARWLLWAGGMLLTGFLALSFGSEIQQMEGKAWLLVALVLAPLAWLLYAVAVFLLQPLNSNRSLPLRLHALGIGLALIAGGLLAARSGMAEDALILTTLCGLLADTALFFMAFHAGEAVPGERWRPAGRRRLALLRRLPGLLGETTCGGLGFAVLLGAGSLLPLAALRDTGVRRSILSFGVLCIGYLLAYALTARWLTARLQRLVSRVDGSWVFLTLAVAGSCVTGIWWAIREHQGSAAAVGCVIAGILEDQHVHYTTHMLALTVWLGLAGALNVPWLVAALRRSPRNGWPAAPPGGAA